MERPERRVCNEVRQVGLRPGALFGALLGVLLGALMVISLPAAAEDFISYEVDSQCEVVNVRAIASATVPRHWADVIGIERATDRLFVDGQRRQVRRIEIPLHRSDREPRQLTCWVDFGGRVLRATLTQAMSESAPTRRGALPERLDVDGGRLPPLGTFTLAINTE